MLRRDQLAHQQRLRQPPPHPDGVKRARGLLVAAFLFGLGGGLSLADFLAASVAVAFGLIGLGIVVLVVSVLGWPGPLTQPRDWLPPAPPWFWLALLVMLLGGLLLRRVLWP